MTSASTAVSGPPVPPPTIATTTSRAPPPTHRNRLLGFGHPLLDISCGVDKMFLDRYAIAIGSCNLAEPSQLMVFEEISQKHEVEFVPGGASMNTIRVARWLTGDDTCGFVGSLGNDEFGCILQRALKRAGVYSAFQLSDDYPTGTCACLIVEKERSLLAHLGAALHLSLDHMRSAPVVRLIEEADFFYLEGFFMNVVSAPSSSLIVCEHAAAVNKTLMLNLSAPYLPHIFKDRFDAVMPFVDILFGNKDDFAAYSESQGWSTGSVSELLLRVVTLPKRNTQRSRMVVMTNGSESTLVAQADGTVIEFKVPSVPPEEIIDTNGAGDAFVGGFVAQLMRGRALEECVRLGHEAASHVIRHNGCTFDDSISLA